MKGNKKETFPHFEDTLPINFIIKVIQSLMVTFKFV